MDQTCSRRLLTSRQHPLYPNCSEYLNCQCIARSNRQAAIDSEFPTQQPTNPLPDRDLLLFLLHPRLRERNEVRGTGKILASVSSEECNNALSRIFKPYLPQRLRDFYTLYTKLVGPGLVPSSDSSHLQSESSPKWRRLSWSSRRESS